MTASEAGGGALPAGACDCHIHVFGPDARYPFAAARSYTPPPASSADYIALRRRLGLERVVLVQPSVYGTDNQRHLDALGEIPGARGVAVIDGSEPDAEMERLARAGFCGVRVNLRLNTVEGPLGPALMRLAGRLKEFGWHLQLNASPAAIAETEAALAGLPVPVMFDHYAGLSVWAGPQQAHCDAVMGLMRTGRFSMKLSAPYIHPRGDGREAGDNARRLVAALVEAAPGGLVWGSNWPHPGFVPPTTPTEAPVAPFREVDDAAMLGLFVEWAGDEALRRRILCDNPAAFYGF